MGKEGYSAALFVLAMCLIINLCLFVPIRADEDERKAYIVYMGNKEMPDVHVGEVYLKMIKEVLGKDRLKVVKAAEYLLYSYKNFKGYVARLTDKEANLMSSMSGVVSVFPNNKNKLQTTRSWDFMGFPSNVERSDTESDIIIGVIDSGIWPESDSFTDEGFTAPPSKWKGTCDTSLNFTCNNKLIGAEYFRIDGNITSNDVASPRDWNGHGTHTASTAAGVEVDGISYLGLGEGTARGGVPSARIAVYKVCWSDECFDADILAAFDKAISDGVDIISISVGGEIEPYVTNVFGIGSFSAMKNGILTSIAAGNEGPNLTTVSNYAPWLLTVAASSTDRKFITEVELGNGLVLEGISLNTFDLENKTFPLILGEDASNISSNYFSRYCVFDSLNKTLVEGKIVICDMLVDGEAPFVAGAAGLIMRQADSLDNPISYPLPASLLDVDDGSLVDTYIRNTTSPYGTILKSVPINDTSAPTIVSFSSRGPNPISPRILKPDLSAPGVAILAAYSPVPSITEIAGDERFVSYKMISGTSMACPHVSGIAAYIKTFHPTWSPAAIKSALMTTAYAMSSETTIEAEFAYGVGHVSPLKARDPGLVYDAGEEDYVKFLCSEGLTETQISMISEFTCADSSQWDLNYPSITLPSSVGAFDTIFTRTVTNVGFPNSTYTATLTIPEGVTLEITVDPDVLEFTSEGEKLSFTVQVSGSISASSLISATLVWDDGLHQVRSPIVVYNLS